VGNWIAECYTQEIAELYAAAPADVDRLLAEVAQVTRERDALAAELATVRAENNRLGAREMAWGSYSDYFVAEYTAGFAPETFNEWYTADLA
jgi:hypothetical protein